MPLLDETPIVDIRGLRVEFRNRTRTIVGVKDVSLSVGKGETVCVVGESGSGKSVSSLSLMRLIEFGGGEITKGEILFDAGDGPSDVVQNTERQNLDIRGNSIGMIFQEPMTSLNPVISLETHMVEGLMIHKGLSRAEAREKALDLFRQVKIPEPERRLRQFPHELSGGMRQRTVIAMALACEPKLLIADEPTTALDVTIQAEILALINRLKRETGTAVLFITHDMSVVAQMADRVVVMYQGEKVEEGSVADIFNSPQHDYTKALLAAVPRLGEMKGKDYPEPMKLLGAASKNQSNVEPVKGTDEPLLEVKNLITRFPVRAGLLRRVVANVHAVEDVSLRINKGRTLSLVGESGCGKSTCGRSILRLDRAHSGRVELDGTDILGLSQSELRTARRDMQMVFQDPFSSLNPRIRLGETVAEPIRYYRLAQGTELEDRVAGLFDRVELPRDFMGRYPHELSGGQRQRVAIARALALGPKLIVADEAVSALDVSVQAQVLNLLLELQAELGNSMLFISHDMAVVERVSHDVGVMYLGRIVEYGPRRAIFENPAHEYTRNLMKAVPVADPTRRMREQELNFRPIPSPIQDARHQAVPSVYRKIGPNHFVLDMEWAGYRPVL